METMIIRSFLVSITCQPLGGAKTHRRRTVVNKALVDADQLPLLASEFGIDSAVPHTEEQPSFCEITFFASEPASRPGARNLFYFLHIHRAENNTPRKKDYLRVAKLLGITPV